MDIVTDAGTEIEALEVEAIAVGVYTDGLSSAALAIDRASAGTVQRVVESGDFKAEIGSSLPLYFPAGIKASVVLLVGLGPRAKCDRNVAFRAGGTAARWLTEQSKRSVALGVDDQWSADVQQALLAGALVGAQGSGLYKTKQQRSEIETLSLAGAEPSTAERGKILGDAMNLTRQLVNEPPSVLYPESFADRVSRMADAESSLEAEVWSPERLESERCQALLAVGQGSDRPPRLAIMRHAGGKPDDAWLAMVGKGVTFDSGGLSLKPTSGMLTMKCDMAGAATVVGAMQAISRLELPVNVMGVIGLVENMPSSRAYKLGDVLTAKNGRTIEVHNTDAEGRLVLADALCVAVEAGADKIVDLATLTGACVVALGNHVAGLMTNHQPWCDDIKAIADQCGERVWQLPMFEEYGDLIKSSIADFKNVGDGRYGGAITAAKLLEQFVDERPWTHIDIAGPAYLEKPKPWIDAGGTGVMVPTLVELARSLCSD